MEEKIKVLIVEDHEIVRNGIKSVFALEDGFEVVGEANSGPEAVKKTSDLEPDVVLMDIRIPEIDGINACKVIKEKNPSAKIMMLSTYDNDEDVYGSIDAGASGYLLKDIAPQDLIEAVRAVSKGEFLLHSAITEKVLNEFSLKKRKTKDVSFTLTEREKDVLKLMAQGQKNSQIAKTLWISEKTVKTHVSNILRKLDQPDRTNAVLFAMHNKLV